MNFKMEKFLYGDVTFKLPAGLKEYREPEKMASLLVGSTLTFIPVAEFVSKGAGRCQENGRLLKRVLVEIGGVAALLTDSEKIIFDKILTGAENKKIAWDLGVTESNVKFHSVKVCKLFGVRRKAEIMALALRR